MHFPEALMAYDLIHFLYVAKRQKNRETLLGNLVFECLGMLP